MIKEDRIKSFIKLIPKLEPAEFLGLCTILCIPFKDVNDKARDGQSLIEEICMKFPMLGRKQQRQILQVMKESQKKN